MKPNPLCQPDEHRRSRRQFLGNLVGAAGACALGGLASPAVAEALRRQDKQVMFIWLDGGISQLESWDPKPHSRFGGPYRSIATSVPGVHVSELMPRTAQQMHHLAVLRSVSTKDNAHSSGVLRIQRGDPKNRGVQYPVFGSAVAKLLGPCQSGLPPYVWIKPYGGGFKTDEAGFLGPNYGALALGDGKPPENLLPNAKVSDADRQMRDELRRKLNSRFAAGRDASFPDANAFVYDAAATLMKHTDVFDASRLDPRDVERYGTHDLGRHLLLGRRMLEAGVRCVKVTSYHWDSHGDHFNASQSLVPQFDRPFAALIEDLHERGMLENVLVVALSEFGRTPRINSHVGRDHWPEAWSIGMAGCGIARGAVIGKTNPLGTDIDGTPYDIGHLFHTWFRALGVSTQETNYDNHGQPLPLAHEDCSLIPELLTA